MEFYYFMKKELDNYEDFFKLTGIYRSSGWQMFFKISALKTFYKMLKPLFNKITPKQVFSVNLAKFL